MLYREIRINSLRTTIKYVKHSHQTVGLAVDSKKKLDMIKK